MGRYTLKIKDIFFFLVSWLFYYIGDLCCNIGYIKIKDKYPFDFMWIWHLYNWFMVKSSNIQEYHSKKNGPWNYDYHDKYAKYIISILEDFQVPTTVGYNYNDECYTLEFYILGQHQAIEVYKGTNDIIHVYKDVTCSHEIGIKSLTIDKVQEYLAYILEIKYYNKKSL